MKLQITIDHLAHAKIMRWMRLAGDNEVSGFGKVMRLPNHLHVSEVTLLQQENTGASTLIDPHDMGRAMYALRDLPGDFNFWWHSHHYMEAYMSGTDYKTIHQFGKKGWLLATVFNHRGETQSAVYVKEPIEFLSEGFPMRVIYPNVDAGLMAEWDELYHQKVTILKPPPKHKKRHRGNYRRWWEKQTNANEVVDPKPNVAVGGLD